MRSRGQLVLIAGVLIAVAIVPITLAYLQLGYAADVEAAAEVTDPEEDAHRLLLRAVHEEASGVPADHPWANRSGAVEAVRAGLESRFGAVETGLLDQGIARSVTYNETAASEWADSECPSGPDRQFGPCVADRGVVVQERAGRTHVLRVAVDLETTTPRRESRVTWVLDAW